MPRPFPAPSPRWAPVLLAAATLAIYAPSLGNGFTNWDDPRYVESVSWVANLKDPLGLLCIALSFALYARGRRGASAIAFTAALLAKSMFFPVAGLFLLLEARQTEERGIGAVVAARHWLVPALLLAALGGLLHVIPAEAAGRTLPGGSLLAAIPTAVWAPWWYLGRTIRLAHPQAVYGGAVGGGLRSDRQQEPRAPRQREVEGAVASAPGRGGAPRHRGSDRRRRSPPRRRPSRGGARRPRPLRGGAGGDPHPRGPRRSILEAIRQAAFEGLSRQ